MRRRLPAVALALLAGAAIAVVSAQDLPRLPADSVLPRAAESPGPVVFSHQVHLAVQSRPDCTACHPKLAPMLGSKPSRPGAITHARMEKGLSCGACHDGKAAHGFEDCASCHRGES